MLRVTTPKDLTTALVKMDLKATAKTARVIFFLRAKQTAYRRGPYGKENPTVNFYIIFFSSAWLMVFLSMQRSGIGRNSYFSGVTAFWASRRFDHGHPHFRRVGRITSMHVRYLRQNVVNLKEARSTITLQLLSFLFEL